MVGGGGGREGFFFNDTATTEIYTLSLHDALPIYADFDVSDEEVEAMERLVSERTDLPAVQATLVVQIAKQRNQLFGGTDNFLVTRTFEQIADLEQKRSMLDCLYAVSAADHTISAQEDQEIRRIASELNLDHAEFIRARLKYTEHLSVLQD